MWSLERLESTGGEPDVIGENRYQFIFGDVSKESPARRRNVMFDAVAERAFEKMYPDKYKDFHGNAEDKVQAWEVDFMNEEEYRGVQKILAIDINHTKSWLKTPLIFL